MADQPKTYAFIDSQNLNLGVQSRGWKLDFKKFRLYLKNKYNVTEAYLFIGKTDGNQNLYTNLQQAGFTLIFKPTVAYVENGKKTMKGNVDAELVLYASAKVYDEYDKAIIVSGDGDFYCLVEYLQENNKLLRVITPNSKYSKLLHRFSAYIFSIENLRTKLEYKKPAHAVGRNLRQSRQKPYDRRSVETLGLHRNGDSPINIAKMTTNVNTNSKRKGGLK